jgi:hypothetical protein
MHKHGKHSKATITNKTRPAGSFSSASQAALLAQCSLGGGEGGFEIERRFKGTPAYLGEGDEAKLESAAQHNGKQAHQRLGKTIVRF